MWRSQFSAEFYGLAMWVLLIANSPQLLAQEKARTWRDAGGKFSIEATLVEVQADTVRLQKSDGSKISVPIAKLSSVDQTYVKNMTQQESPFSSPDTAKAQPIKVEPLTVEYSSQEVLPSQDIADLPSVGPVVLLSLSTTCEPLEADPEAPLPSVKPGQTLVAQTDAYDDISNLITLNARQALVALSISRMVAGSQDPPQGKLLVGQLPQGPFTLVFNRKETIRLFDHHEATGQTLLVGNLDVLKRGGEILVMEGLFDGKPVEKYRRRLPGYEKPGFKPLVTQARLIAPDVAVVVVDSVLYCWNLKTAELLYRTEDNIVNSPAGVAFSANRKWVAVPQQNGFSLLDTAKGADRGYIDAETGLKPGVVFHPDGRRIAYCANNTWGVWDIVDVKKTVSGIVTEHLGDKLTGWIGSDWFITDSGRVIDTRSQMLVWVYYTGVAAAKKLWNGSMSMTTTNSGLKIETLPVPDSKAQVAVRRLDQQKNLMVTAPGTEVRIEIESKETVDKKALITALTEAIERAGWKINPAAKLAVVAEIGRGAPYKLEYTSRPIGGTGQGGQKHTVEIKPFTAMLKIRSSKEVLWTRATENHVPPFLFLRGDETVEAAVKKFERPQPEFFSSLQIPPRIPKAELSKGLGASRLDKGVWVDFKLP